MRANLDGVEAWKGGDILPPGCYLCRIDNAEEGESSGGYPQLELDLSAVEGDYKGGTIKDWIVVIPKTYGKVRQLLEAAGLEIPAGDFEIPVGSLPGRTVMITVRQEPKPDGQLANRVKSYEEARDPVPAGANGRDQDIPFRVRDRIPPGLRCRDLFTGDRFAA